MRLGLFALLFSAGCQSFSATTRCGHAEASAYFSDIKQDSIQFVMSDQCAHAFGIDKQDINTSNTTGKAIEGAVKGTVEGLK